MLRGFLAAVLMMVCLVCGLGSGYGEVDTESDHSMKIAYQQQLVETLINEKAPASQIENQKRTLAKLQAEETEAVNDTRFFLAVVAGVSGVLALVLLCKSPDPRPNV